MHFESGDWVKILKYLNNAKDHAEELYDAMKDIETYGEVDHDGMPVVNSDELKEDLRHLGEIIERIEKELDKEKRSTTKS